MFIRFRLKSRFILLVLLGIISVQVSSEPYIAFHTKLPCASCHVNPSGGGMRNDYGRIYGNTILAANQHQIVAQDFGKISPNFSFGSDFRFLIQEQETSISKSRTSGIETQSGQVYLQFRSEDYGLEIYLDQKIKPDDSETREMLLIKRLSGGDFLKVGKMIPQLGLRIEDDSALIRQITGFNFDNNDLGVEYGLNGLNGLHTISVNTGNSDTSNDDGKYRTILRSEFYLNDWRLGAGLSFNPGTDGKTNSSSLFAGYTIGDWVLLGDLSWVDNHSDLISIVDRKQFVALFEVNWRFQQGHNVKFTEEYLDPDTDLAEDHQVRHSLLYEYTPYSNIQLRMGIRNRQAPPQIEILNVDTIFFQAHLFF